MQTFEKDGKKLIYVPIDIEVELPSEEELLAYHNEHHVLNTDYEDYIDNRHIYTMCATRYKLDDWRIWPNSLHNDKKGWKTPVDDYELLWNVDFKEKFPSLVKLILELPFKQVAGAAFLYQIGAYKPHFDSADQNFPMEPRRYNVLLTSPDRNTFYMGDNDNRHYPEVDPKYPCFAFNNTDVTHGTEQPTGLKIVMGIMGILDDEKHEALIKRSVEKFPDKAIWL